MKFFIVLLAIVKYALIVILFLLLLVLILALILMVSPIRYKAVLNYKNNNLYYNVDVTYLGKIVAFKLKGVKSKFKASLRLLHKTVPIKSDKKQQSKNQSSKKSKSTSSSTSKKSSKTYDDSVNSKTAYNKDSTEPLKSTKSSVSNIPLDVAQKITPTTNLEEAVKISGATDIHNSKDDVKENINLKDNYENKEKVSESRDKYNSENNSFTKDKLVQEKFNDKKVEDVNNADNNNDTNSDTDNNADNENLSFIEKIYKFFGSINFYIESYKTYPYRDKLFVKFKKILTNLKDALFPKVFDCSGEIFIHSPSTTGQLLGFLYMLHGLNDTFNVTVDADFETEKNDFTALISGRIIIIKLVSPVVSFIWLGLKAEAKRRKISRFKLIKILINNQ